MSQRHFEGVFHLSQNLRFANHHRVQTAGDAEQMDNGPISGLPIEMRRQLLGRHGEMCVSKEFLDAAVASLQFLHDGVDLHPVAGRQQQPFLDAGIPAEPRERLTEAAFGNGQPFPDLHRCSFVAQSNDDNMHIRRPIQNS